MNYAKIGFDTATGTFQPFHFGVSGTAVEQLWNECQIDI